MPNKNLLSLRDRPNTPSRIKGRGRDAARAGAGVVSGAGGGRGVAGGGFVAGGTVSCQDVRGVAGDGAGGVGRAGPGRGARPRRHGSATPDPVQARGPEAGRGPRSPARCTKPRVRGISARHVGKGPEPVWFWSGIGPESGGGAWSGASDGRPDHQTPAAADRAAHPRPGARGVARPAGRGGGHRGPGNSGAKFGGTSGGRAGILCGP